MKILRIGLIGLAVSLATFGTASATIVHVEYEGTVSYGFDQTGVFGVQNRDLTGSSYVAKITYDTTKGEIIENKDDVRQYLVQTLQGNISGPSPAQNLEIIVGGLSKSITPNFGYISGNGVAHTESHVAGFITYLNSVMTSSYSVENSVSSTFFEGIGYSITKPYVYIPQPGDGASMSFIWAKWPGGGTATEWVTGVVTLEKLTVTVDSVAPVPEPSTWALMLVGFCGVALFASKRRRATRTMET